MQLDLEFLENRGLTFAQINKLLKLQDNNLDLDFVINFGNFIKFNILEELINEKNLSQDQFDMLYYAKYGGLEDIDFIKTGNYERRTLRDIISTAHAGKNYKPLLNPLLTRNEFKAYKRLIFANIEIDDRFKGISEEDAKRYINFIKVPDLKKYSRVFDVDKLLKTGYKMKVIELIFYNISKKGINVLPFIKDKKFELQQVNAIAKILENDADIKKRKYKLYFKPNLAANAIKKLYELDKLGYPIEQIIDVCNTQGQINVYGIMFKRGFDIKPFTKYHFTAEQLNEFLSGLENDIDMSSILPYNFNKHQIKTLIYALKYNKENPEKQINIDVILDPKIDVNTMRHAIKVLKSGTLNEKIALYQELDKKKNSEEISINPDKNKEIDIDK